MINPREIYGMKWSEKEYIIVLYCYYKYKGTPQHSESPFIKELSQILGRTPHSILYRLQNYSSIDPEETNPLRKGKVHITDVGRRLFNEWSSKKESLKETAEAFLRDERYKMEPDLFNPNPVRIPITFKNYELLDEIGKGGFGIVFSCLNTRNDETYAIKIIDSLKLQERECIKRFIREIRALRSINHPNIIKIYDDNLGTEPNFPGFVMDLAEYDLTKYVNLISKQKNINNIRPILDKDEAKSIIISIMSAIHELHKSNPPIIHRDINPQNILRLFDGTWVLSDFSLAKFLPPIPVSTSFATESHVGMGTAHYASPEQCNEMKETDIRTDIYSLGWLIWELFSKEGPFVRKDPSGLPEDLEHIFLKSTSYSRDDRYQTIDEMIREIKIVLG